MRRDDAVRRHDLACADDDDVARPELVDADLLDRAARVAMGDARRALDEETELTPRAPGRPRLERGASRHHQGDDRRREVLAEREGPDDRDERDRIDPDIAAQQRARGGDDEGDEDDDRPGSPREVGARLLPGEPEHGLRRRSIPARRPAAPCPAAAEPARDEGASRRWLPALRVGAELRPRDPDAGVDHDGPVGKADARG